MIENDNHQSESDHIENDNDNAANPSTEDIKDDGANASTDDNENDGMNTRADKNENCSEKGNKGSSANDGTYAPTNDEDAANEGGSANDGTYATTNNRYTIGEKTEDSGTLAQGSMVPTTTFMAPTPMRDLNHVSNTLVRGSVVPTATSMAPTPMCDPNRVSNHTSIRKDSGKSTTDLGPIGEDGFLLFLSFTLFIFNLVLSIGNVGPLLDDGNKIYFNLTS